jgi:hypothetical protein
MDALILSKVLRNRNTEGFSQDANSPTTTSPKETNKWSVSGIISGIISLMIGAYAAYLSWSCNTLTGTNVFLKVIFAAFAFLFGFIYLIFYLVFRWADCKHIRENTAAAPTPLPAPTAAPLVQVAPVRVGGRRKQ